MADYLQIHSRSPEIVFRYKRILSPFSALEHKATQAVEEITAAEDDPELLKVRAKPKDVETFLRIKDWLRGIQGELDASWAVLGELYGRISPLSSLGLRYRRIRSNIDDVLRLRRSVTYVPTRIHFDVVRPDLLALLVGPLYGDEPSFGIRELVQNAVDAVRELDAYLIKHPSANPAVRRLQDYDVMVKLSTIDESGWANLIVSDRGIGMTEDIVHNYFFRAGASFRSSEWWRNQFEVRTSPDQLATRATVLRSGRFGVGALAAFLLGSRITVETKHITAEEGLRFTASLESDPIEVTRDPTIPVGTCVTVRVTSEAYRQLAVSGPTTIRPRLWDWHCLEYPSVRRMLPKDKTVRSNAHSFDLEVRSKGHWRLLEAPLPYRVFWTLNHAPALICNGLFVSDSQSLRRVPSHRLHRDDDVDFVSYPRVAIEDPDAALPLRLQRDGLRVDDYPFGEELIRDLLRDMLSWLFFHGPESQTPFTAEDNELGPWLNYSFQDEMLVLTPEGFGLRIASLLNERKAHRIVFVRSPIQIHTLADPDTVIFAGEWEAFDSTKLSRLRIVDQNGKETRPEHAHHVFFERGGAGKKGKKVRIGKEEYVVDEKAGSWKVLTSSGFPSGKCSYEWPPAAERRIFGAYLTELVLPAQSRITLHRWYLDDIWEEFFGNCWIPYAREERMKIFAAVVPTLQRYYCGESSEYP